MIQIAPSLLSANLLRLESEVEALLDAGADFIHLDVMDHHYVPNLTFGPDFCRALHQRFPGIRLDVHLMVSPVSALIEQFASAGASRISIHPDASNHLDRDLRYIRECHCQVGLAINPATTLDVLTYTHTLLDFVLIMTVNPGFGGQALLSHCLPKIKDIRTRYPALSISVDGGINTKTIPSVVNAGADTIIVGSGLFHHSDTYAHTIQTLKSTIPLP